MKINLVEWNKMLILVLLVRKRRGSGQINRKSRLHPTRIFFLVDTKKGN
jgi:hypothetical protein